MCLWRWDVFPRNFKIWRKSIQTSITSRAQILLNFFEVVIKIATFASPYPELLADSFEECWVNRYAFLLNNFSAARVDRKFVRVGLHTRNGGGTVKKSLFFSGTIHAAALVTAMDRSQFVNCSSS